MMHGVQVIGAGVSITRKKAAGNGGQEVSPFSKLTLRPKVTTAGFPSREVSPWKEKKSKIREYPLTPYRYPLPRAYGNILVSS